MLILIVLPTKNLKKYKLRSRGINANSATLLLSLKTTWFLC